jgi:hypothetical protein
MLSCYRIGNFTLRDINKPVVVLVHVFPYILHGCGSPLAVVANALVENITAEYISL